MFVDGKRPLFKVRLAYLARWVYHVMYYDDIHDFCLAFYDYSYVGDSGVRLFVDSFSCINKI
ncbi:Uncharacterised protein [Klebsiella pneumoniae]|nr:Uncharacterised protein [Klebsiella pneumoniae]